MKIGGIITRIILWGMLFFVLLGVLLVGLSLHLGYGAGVIAADLFDEIKKEWHDEWDDDTNPGMAVGQRESLLSETISALNVDWQKGHVRIALYDGDKISISENGEFNEEDAMRYQVKNGVLTVRYSQWKDSLKIDLPEKDLQIYLPKKMEKNLKSLELELVSAQLELEGVKAKTMSLETVSGDVLIKEVSVKELEIENLSGQLHLFLDAEAAQIESLTGDVIWNCKTAPKKLEWESSTGDIELSFPDPVGFRAEVEMPVGEFSSEWESTKQGDSYLYGTGEKQFSFESVSGAVRLKKASD